MVSNSIVMFNTGTLGDNWVAGSGVTPRMNYSCTAPIAGLTGAGNLEADPLFGDGDGRLSPGSPCVNAGINEEWMPGGVDLDGRPRIDRFVRKVDMGCYEFMPRGSMFSFR